MIGFLSLTAFLGKTEDLRLEVSDMNKSNRQAPSCMEVIGGLLLLLAISTILRVVSASVQRHTFEQINHYRTQSETVSPFGPVR